MPLLRQARLAALSNRGCDPNKFPTYDHGDFEQFYGGPHATRFLAEWAPFHTGYAKLRDMFEVLVGISMGNTAPCFGAILRFWASMAVERYPEFPYGKMCSMSIFPWNKALRHYSQTVQYYTILGPLQYGNAHVSRRLYDVAQRNADVKHKIARYFRVRHGNKYELTFPHVCTVWFWAKMPEWGFENPAYVWETQKGMQCFVKSTDCS